MKIGILGELTRFEELKQTLPSDAELIYDEKILPYTLDKYDFVFDLNFDSNPTLPGADNINTENTIFILSAATIELQGMTKRFPFSNQIFGMNCLPSFINRKVKEISYHNTLQQEMIKTIEEKLNWQIASVKDRVGMVTPRILFMLINEAYYTLQEGTASKADIDTGMKLGTNYPFGPFEWCEKLGAKTIVNMLEKIYEDTKDERYKICPMLKTEAGIE